MRNDLIFFLGILIVIFAVWVGSGGPSRPISYMGPYLKPVSGTATTAQPYGNPDEYHSVQGTSWWPLGGGNTTNDSIAAADASEYRDLVTLSRDTSGALNSDQDKEYVIVQVSMRATKPISTAGWHVVSKETSAGANFPTGAEVAKSGRVNLLTPITLNPGDQAIITSGRSPVGVSFRENACTGYLAEHQEFAPSLARNCPTPSQEFSEFGDDDEQCLSHIRNIAQCTTNTRVENNISNSCEDFIDEYLNYNGCVDAHEKDPGFLGQTWRVYLGERDELWRRSHETILLLDATGKTIDAVSY